MKANNHAFSQMAIMLSTKPTLNKLMTKDIMHDIKSDIKKEKTSGVYLGLIMLIVVLN